MKVDIVRETDSKKKIFVDLTTEEVGPYFETTYKKYRSRATIPGYRKGKAPKNVVYRMFKKEIEADAIEEVIRSYYTRVLDEHDIDSVGSGEVQNIDYKENTGFSFEILVEVIPDFELVKNSGFELKKTVHEVEDKHVASALRKLQEDHATLAPSENPAREGDVVTAEIQVLDAGGVPIIGKSYKDRKFLLKKEDLEQDLYDGLLGVKNGDVRNIKVRHSHKTESGETHEHLDHLRVTASEVHERKLPGLDDDFARDLGKYESLQQLKDRVREEISKQWASMERQNLTDRVIDEIIRNNEIPVPDGILNNYLDNVVEEAKGYSKGKPVDEVYVRDQYRPTAIRAIKWFLARKRIVEAEALTVTREDLERKRAELAEARRIPVDQLEIDLENPEHRQKLGERLLEDKVIDFILKNSTVDEVIEKLPDAAEEPAESKIITH